MYVDKLSPYLVNMQMTLTERACVHDRVMKKGTNGGVTGLLNVRWVNPQSLNGPTCDGSRFWLCICSCSLFIVQKPPF